MENLVIEAFVIFQGVYQVWLAIGYTACINKDGCLCLPSVG